MEVRFKVVSPVQVFNLPLYEHHLVIDTRTEEEYQQGHIVSAVHYPSWSPTLSNEEQDASLLKFIHKVIDECLRPENPDPVVIYGTGDDACVQAKWLAKRLETLKKDRLSVATTTSTASKQSEKFDPVEYFCLTIADKTKEVWLLGGGTVRLFVRQFNFHRDVTFTTSRDRSCLPGISCSAFRGRLPKQPPYNAFNTITTPLNRLGAADWHISVEM